MPGGVVRSHPSAAKRLQRQLHSYTGNPLPASQALAALPHSPSGNPIHLQEAPHHVFIHQPHPLQRSGHAPQPHSWFRHRLLPGLQHLPFRGCGHEHCPPERHEACLYLILLADRSGTVPEAGRESDHQHLALRFPWLFRLSKFHDDRGRRRMSGLCQFYLDLHGYGDGQTGEGGSGTGSVLPDRREVSYGICGPEDPYAGRN